MAEENPTGKIPPPPQPVEKIDADAEKALGTEVGNAFPVSEIVAAARKKEKEEGELIDKSIKAERAAEATAPTTTMSEALANPKPLKEKKNGNENGKGAPK